MTDQADLQALSDAATRCPTCKALDAEHNLAIANGLVIEAHHVLRRTRAHEAEWHREALRAATPVVPAEGLRDAVDAVQSNLVAAHSKCIDERCTLRTTSGEFAIAVERALAASPSPDTDAGLDAQALRAALFEAFDSEDGQEWREPETLDLFTSEVAEVYARLATPDKEQPYSIEPTTTAYVKETPGSDR